MDTQNGSKMKVVYTVVERSTGKSFWTRVGIGFVNKDGSINLRLDAVPVNGTLQVRDWDPPVDQQGPGDRHGDPFDAAERGKAPSRPRSPARDSNADPLSSLA